MQEDQLQDDLASIRNLMERSSKFISLSGLSGVLAGVYALIGAVLAYGLVYQDYGFFGYRPFYIPNHQIRMQLIFISILVLVASVSTGLWLTYRKAQKKRQQFWTPVSRQLLFYMAVPLFTGGIFTLIMLSRGYFGIIAPAMLMFYGLSLISCSNFTYNDLRYLGISEIVLGLLAACYPGYGLLFWAVGFGVLHIVYGWSMYLKYDR
ncbi:hypothetical protein GCM10027037_33120 [Mucilaginibacter koreensis]